MRDAVVILSGGMDSSTVLYEAKARGHKVSAALTFNYGQRHAKEIRSARAIAHAAGVRHEVVRLPSSLFLGSALTGKGKVPHGHYTAPSMKRTLVPNRNLVLLSLAAAYAQSVRAAVVFYGAHAGDHAIYPDCRPGFFDAAREAVQQGTGGAVELVAPYMHMTKKDIVLEGTDLAVPYALTWSCYEGGRYHCGKCGTCVERMEAFSLAAVKDPTVYA